jgi:hypothetical protein
MKAETSSFVEVRHEFRGTNRVGDSEADDGAPEFAFVRKLDFSPSSDGKARTHQLAQGTEFLVAPGFSAYKNPGPAGCPEGVIDSLGHRVLGIRDDRARVFRRIGGVEDLFEIAVAHPEDLDIYLRRYSIRRSRDVGTFCHASGLGRDRAWQLLSPTMAVLESFRTADATVLIGKTSLLARPVLGDGDGESGFLRCSPDGQSTRITFADRAARGAPPLINFDLELSGKMAQGKIHLNPLAPRLLGLFASQTCEIEVNSHNSVRIDPWTVEIRDPKIHMRVTLDPKRDPVKITILNADKSCLPEAFHADRLWLWQFLVESAPAITRAVPGDSL